MKLGFTLFGYWNEITFMIPQYHDNRSHVYNHIFLMEQSFVWISICIYIEICFKMFWIIIYGGAYVFVFVCILELLFFTYIILNYSDVLSIVLYHLVNFQQNGNYHMTTVGLYAFQVFWICVSNVFRSFKYAKVTVGCTKSFLITINIINWYLSYIFTHLV